MSGAPLHPLLIAMLRGKDVHAALADMPREHHWSALVHQARVEGLTVPLARWLGRRSVGTSVPPAVIATLHERCAGLAARNLLLANELAVILRACERHRLMCAPLRGVALAERLYGDATVRPMGDIDLLVDRRDVGALADILVGLGFRELDRRRGFAETFSYTRKFFKDQHGWIVVEPHWTLAYPPVADRIDMDRVWRRCRRGSVAGVETWLLPVEPLLLHLALHILHREPDVPYLWLAEMDRLVRQQLGDIDWMELVALAAPTGLAPFVAARLSAVKAELSTPIPDGVVEALARAPGRAAERRLARLLAPDARVDGKESLALLFTVAGVHAKLRYAFALLFPTPEFMMVQYGLTRRGQLGPAYARRVGRFSWEGVKGIVSLFR